MRQGKLPPDMLAALLGRLSVDDPSVVVGPQVGEDAAVLQLGDTYLVVAMDPITFATDLIGWYAVQVNANDVAVMGARPRWLLASLLVPPTAEQELVDQIFQQVADACDELDILPVGGHTEVTGGIDRPIVVGCMLGEVARGGIVQTSGATPGDVIVLCGSAGIEGTAILARDAARELKARGASPELLARGREFLHHPGISVVQAALKAAEVGVKAMHDPTEGGVATGLRELALASKVGLEIVAEKIPIDPVTADLCDRLELDPLGLLASGALLLATQAEDSDELLSNLGGVGAAATVIGRAVPKDEGLHVLRGGAARVFPEFARDEIARFFEGRSASPEAARI